MKSTDAAAFLDDGDPAVLFQAALGEADLRDALEDAERAHDAFEFDVDALARRRSRG